MAETVLPGVSFISGGTLRGDPTMLLIEGRLADCISWAERYDLVLLDGPAAASFPDARNCRPGTPAEWCGACNGG